MAQLAEQLTCNQQVNGSSPFIGLFFYGWVPEWPKGADCKSVAIASKVRILPHPFMIMLSIISTAFFVLGGFLCIKNFLLWLMNVN